MTPEPTVQDETANNSDDSPADRIQGDHADQQECEPHQGSAALTVAVSQRPRPHKLLSGADWLRSPVKTFNLQSDEWDGTRDREGWRVKGAFVGQRIGGELIGATMSEVEPGDKLWPYHTHHLNEEWVIVLRGEPTLRTPAGERVLKQGDVVCFPRGKDGAHQIINRTDSPIRVLMLSSMIGGEIVEYLDTGKVLAKDAQDEDIMFTRPGPTAEFWEGED